MEPRSKLWIEKDGKLADHLRVRFPELEVVHGDATLSNMMIDDDGTLGFIDCGHAGRGDRYLDLAVLAADIADKRGAEAAAQFAGACGLPLWDAAKARYYLDLYELF